MMSLSSHFSFPLLLILPATILLSQPGWGAPVPMGRANPFKPLIFRNATASVILPSLPPVLEPQLPEEMPRLVGIASDKQGAIAAIKLDDHTDFLRLNEQRRGLRLIFVGKNRAIVEWKGKPLSLNLEE